MLGLSCMSGTPTLTHTETHTQKSEKSDEIKAVGGRPSLRFAALHQLITPVMHYSYLPSISCQLHQLIALVSVCVGGWSVKLNSLNLSSVEKSQAKLQTHSFGIVYMVLKAGRRG